MRTSESKGHWQRYDSSAVLDLKFLLRTRRKTDRNFKSTALGGALSERIAAASVARMEPTGRRKAPPDDRLRAIRGDHARPMTSTRSPGGTPLRVFSWHRR